MNYKKELRVYILTSKNAKKARDFDRQNPDFYKILNRLVADAKKAGINKYGIKGLFEVMRWHYQIEKRNGDFKVNNNYAPYFARKLMAQFDGLDGFFDIRETKVNDTMTGKK